MKIIIFQELKWSTDSNELAIQKLNRLQNKLEIYLANAKTAKPELIYEEVNKYYIDITDSWSFLHGNEKMIISSERSGYNHLYLIDIKTGNIEALTKGSWDITDVYGYDNSNSLCYFAAARNSPLDRDIYSVSLKGNLKKIICQTGYQSCQL